MTDVMDEFQHLNAMSIGELHSRRQELIGSGPTSQLSDDTLRELLAIARILRRRSVAPAAKKATKTVPSLDAL